MFFSIIHQTKVKMLKRFITVLVLAVSISCTAESTSKNNTENVTEPSKKVSLEDKIQEDGLIDSSKKIDQEPLTNVKMEETPSPMPEKEIKKGNSETAKEVIIEKAETPEKTVVEKNTDNNTTNKTNTLEVVAYGPSHASFDALLKKYVSASGKVNYDGFKTEKSKLDSYLSLLAKNAPSSGWNREEKLAYWINLYNAATIQLILKNYPLKSIMDINGGKAWDLKFVKSGSQMLSLNQIENEIIRPTFKEPRIHFAVNCAAKSCPKLLNGAFLAHKLDSQLEVATKKFINNKAKNTISSSSIQISKIFEWYAVDFGGKEGLVNYFNKYSDIKINSSAKVTFMEYDWALNK